MNKNIRRIIFIFFIVAFLVTAPLLILYSAGYRYNFKKHKIQSVGALFLDSNPREVHISINGKTVSKKMPAKMINVKPGSYSITIEKDGYYSWEKALEVHDKQTTFAQNVTLFKKSEPSIIVEGTINIFKQSPQKKKLLYSVTSDTWEELWLLDLEGNKQPTLLYRTAYAENKKLYNQKIWWSPNESYVLIQTQNDYFIININQPNQLILVKNITTIPIHSLRWDNRNDNILYGINKNIIYRITLNPLSADKIYTFKQTNEYNHDFLIKNGELYFIDNSTDTIKLQKTEITDNNKKAENQYLVELNTPDITFTHYNEQYFGVQQQETTILLDTQTTIPTYKIIPAKEISWDPTYTQYTYNNDFEIYYETLNTTNTTSDFITRYSQPITQVLWYNPHYIIFSNHQQIMATEIDGRAARNSTPLNNTIQLTHIALDNQGEYLYISGRDVQTKKQGLFTLQLSESNKLFKFLPL